MGVRMPSFLDAMVVVITNVILNHIDQLFLAGKTLAVIAFPLQDTPETFHWSIIDALGYSRHTLCHTGIFNFLMEYSVSILKASVAVK